MSHPLTYEMMEKIHGNRPGYSNPFDEADMRAAADWQLEECVKEVDQMLLVLQVSDVINEPCRLGLLDGFKRYMRPQEES